MPPLESRLRRRLSRAWDIGIQSEIDFIQGGRIFVGKYTPPKSSLAVAMAQVTGFPLLNLKIKAAAKTPSPMNVVSVNTMAKAAAGRLAFGSVSPKARKPIRK